MTNVAGRVAAKEAAEVKAVGAGISRGPRRLPPPGTASPAKRSAATASAPINPPPIS